jgi:hypothetical protein
MHKREYILRPDTLKLYELRSHLQQLKLSTTGNKNTLVERLQEALLEQANLDVLESTMYNGVTLGLEIPHKKQKPNPDSDNEGSLKASNKDTDSISLDSGDEGKATATKRGMRLNGGAVVVPNKDNQVASTKSADSGSVAATTSGILPSSKIIPCRFASEGCTFVGPALAMKKHLSEDCPVRRLCQWFHYGCLVMIPSDRQLCDEHIQLNKDFVEGKLSRENIFVNYMSPTTRQRLPFNEHIKEHLENNMDCFHRLRIPETELVDLIQYIQCNKPTATELYFTMFEKWKSYHPAAGLAPDQIRRLLGSCQLLLQEFVQCVPETEASHEFCICQSVFKTCYAQVLQVFTVKKLPYFSATIDAHSWDTLQLIDWPQHLGYRLDVNYVSRFSGMPQFMMPKFVTDVIHEIPAHIWFSKPFQAVLEKRIVPILHSEWNGDIEAIKKEWLQAIEPFAIPRRIFTNWDTLGEECTHCRYNDSKQL